MKKAFISRQGDVVLIHQTDKKSVKGEKINPINGKTTLALGEKTGHAHVLSAVTTIELKVGDKEYLKVNEPSTLRHEEHAPIEFAKGLYEKRICREYTPAGVRKVED